MARNDAFYRRATSSYGEIADLEIIQTKRIRGSGSGLAWGLISRFSVIDYEVQDGTRKLVTKITCARALVRRISANGKFTQTRSGTQIRLLRVWC